MILPFLASLGAFKCSADCHSHRTADYKPLPVAKEPANSKEMCYRLSCGDDFCRAEIRSCAAEGALTSDSVMIFAALVGLP